MRAMVLAAGKGERVRPLCDEVPKPMLRVAGTPILERVIDHLRDYGIREIVVNLHHSPEAIRSYFGNGESRGVSISYSFEPELLGTAGAVRKAADKLGDPFLVYYGDNLCDCDFARLQAHHAERKALGTIVISESYDDLPGGIVECDGDGRVMRFIEKPVRVGGEVRWENAGIYLLKRGILDHIPADRPSDFARDVFPAVLAGGGRLFCHRAEGYVRGLDTPKRLERIERELREGRLALR